MSTNDPIRRDACRNLRTILTSRTRWYAFIVYHDGVQGEARVANYLRALDLYTDYNCHSNDQAASSDESTDPVHSNSKLD
jgi:hypothetical protein